jgi:hypothetical protein
MVLKHFMNSIFKRKNLDEKQANINERLKYAILQNSEHQLKSKSPLPVK